MRTGGERAVGGLRAEAISSIEESAINDEETMRTGGHANGRRACLARGNRVQNRPRYRERLLLPQPAWPPE